MIIILTLLLTIGAGYLYLAGGQSWGNTKYRDMGVPLMMLAQLYVLGLGHWSLLIAYFLMFAALTTYRYFLPKPKDYLWYHYSLHGFFVSLALFPYAIATGEWTSLIIRVLFTTIAIGAWSHYTSEVRLEESGRGIIFNISLLLMLIR